MDKNKFKNKIKTRNIISAIIRNYAKDGGCSFLNSFERLKLSKGFDLYRTEEITPLIERYIKRYKTYLLYEHYKKSEIYQRFHYLKFQVKLSSVDTKFLQTFLMCYNTELFT